MSYRKEKKYRVTRAEFNELKISLLKSGMTPLYTTRVVNSIYFDSIDYQMYYGSEEGVLERRKVRIRWYNDSKKFTLEKKFSSIEGRFKTTKKLKHINCADEVHKYRPLDQLYGILIPTLKVSYKRTYFAFKGTRITFDTNINYESVRAKNLIIHQDPEQVIEIKVPLETSDDFIETLVPYQTTRFSKYCRGLLMSEGQVSAV